MNTPILTIDQFFHRCCAEEVMRYDMTAPHAVNGMLYASNSHIVVRRPVPRGWKNKPNKIFPPVEMLPWSRDQFVEHVVPVPEIGARQGHQTCETCKGKGRLPRMGMPNLMGNAGDECGDCDGTGKAPMVCGIRLDGFQLSNVYCHLFNEAGITHVIPEKLSPGKRAAMIARFELGDTEGLIMPFNSPTPYTVEEYRSMGTKS